MFRLLAVPLAAVSLMLSPIAFSDNPVVSHIYTADSAGLVYDDRFYLYTGHDESDGSNYDMDDWHVFSSTDMVNWKDHGEALAVTDFSWVRADAWASQAIERNGKFYWYISAEHNSIGGKAIGVAVADTPYGPFTDARGTALVTNDMTTATGISWDDIDPTVFIDDDDQAYLFWGNTALYWARLADNMIELEGGIHTVSLPDFTEAPYVHKRGDLYYLSYAAGWPERIDYATSTSIAGPWTYQGSIISETLPSGTNHQSIVEYKGDWYLTYHNSDLPGGGEYRRSVAIDYLYYNDDGTIQEVVMTADGVDPVGPPPEPEPVPDEHSLIWSGGPFTLNGTDSYVDLPDNLLSTCVDCTVATWVNVPGTETWSRIFDFGNDRLTNMFLTPNAGGGNLRFAIREANSGGEQIVDTTAGLALGEWQHVAVTLAGETATVYLNGNPIGSSSTVTIDPADMGAGTTVNNRIGRSNWPADPLLEGQISDFKVYNYALTAAEVDGLADTGPGSTLPAPGVPHQIVARHSGLALEVADASTTAGANVQQGGAGQTWHLVDQGEGWYTIINDNSGLALDDYNWLTEDGANVVQWDAWGGAPQLWRLEDAGNGYYYIVNQHSGKPLDVSGGSLDEGANVLQWTQNGGLNQQWDFVE